MKRVGTVLVFKKDVTAEQAAEALEKIADVLDLPKGTNELVDLPGNRCTFRPVPFQMIHKIEAFNDKYGRPVFYIP